MTYSYEIDYGLDPVMKSKLLDGIRHLGLMIGIELREKAKPFLLKLMEEGVLALPAGATVIRLLPPLTISEQELHQVADTLHKVLAD